MKNAENVKYFTPEELGLFKIAHRPEVEKRCGRDCTVLIKKNTKEVVSLTFKLQSNNS